MRIGIDARALQEPFPSGVSFYTKQLLEELFELPESRQHTFVLFFNGANFKNSELLTQLQNEWKGKPIEWRVRGLPNKLLTFTHMVSRFPGLRWMFGEVDVVYVPNVQFFPWRDTRIPFVMTVHDLSFERYPDCLSFKGRLRHRFVHPKKMIAAAKKIITVSHSTAHDLEELYGVPSEKIHTIYPGVNQEQPIHSASSLELPKKYILSLGTIEPRKNIDVLLSAWQELRTTMPDVDLVIAGHAGWKSEKTLSTLKRLSEVHYLGYIDERMKEHLFESASAFVYPSVYEGFGFPPLEVQQHGVPVIVGNHSSLPEVLQNSALYADVMDEHSLTRAMKEILTDQPLRDTLIQRGQDNVKRFQWKKSAQEFLKLIQHL